MRFTVLIPARLASTRLPNKPLADLAGKPMVVRVAERAKLCNAGGEPARVVVAADSATIVAACEAHQVEAVLTRADHPSGSDRLAEACEQLGIAGDQIVVNVQGDEPLIEPALIESVARLLAERPEAAMSTAAHAIASAQDWLNPNVVKVVLDRRQLALYFSRAPIPWWRDGAAGGVNSANGAPQLPQLPQPAPLRHIGIYGYRAEFLRGFPRLEAAPIERIEALEQLRVLWHGHRIAVHVTEHAPGPGVDTPEDLARVRALYAS
ncbi:MAG: 3-deoxy-manno-octulosonate cytidylyltransferase [Proteobacteria bacterium]|nr:3-deoxy-manno-octulosonate cytidylyltransferase [Pseudomonadota bacterium]